MIIFTKPTRLLKLALFFVTSLLLGEACFASAQELEIVNMVNQQRIKAGVKPLKVNDKLMSAARTHSHAMAKSGIMSHDLNGNPSSRVKKEGYYAQMVGENIGHAGSPTQMVQLWMKSHHHKQNILNPYFTSTGVGITTAADGTKYYTQVFAKGAKKPKSKKKK